MQKVAIKQPPPPAEEVPTDVLADAIVAISDAVKKLKAGPLTDKALLLLIHNAIPQSDRPTQKQIAAVLDAAESLKSIYVKGK